MSSISFVTPRQASSSMSGKSTERLKLSTDSKLRNSFKSRKKSLSARSTKLPTPCLALSINACRSGGEKSFSITSGTERNSVNEKIKC